MELDRKMLDHWPNGFIFDWANDYIEPRLKKEKPFDLIISLGLQLSFSQNVEKGILKVSHLLGSKGIVLFDIWNKAKSKPVSLNYSIQTMSKKELENVLKRVGLRVHYITYGPRLYRYFPRLMTLQSRLFRAKSLFLTKGI